MSSEPTSRRTALRTAATLCVAAALPPGALAQIVRVDPLKFSGRDAGAAHRERLEEASRALRNREALSPEGLSALVDLLEQPKILSKVDAAILRGLIKSIFGATTIDGLVGIVSKELAGLPSNADQVVTAIISIAADSANYIKTALSGVTVQEAVLVLAHDISGAISGINAGVRLAGPNGAIVGAVIGGAASSIIGASRIKR